MKMKIGNKGISLIEVMIGGSIALGLGLAVTKMSVNNGKNAKLVERNLEVSFAMSEIHKTITNPDSCKNTLAGLDATNSSNINEIKNQSGIVLFKKGQYGSSGLKIDNIKLDSSDTNVNVIPNAQGTTNLIITFDRGDEVPATQFIDKKIRLTVNTINTNEIDTCSGLSGGANSIWKRDILTPTKIYYNEGNVGIGTSSPSRNLHIQENKNGSVGINIENSNTDPNASTKIKFAGPGTASAMLAVIGPNNAQPLLRDKLVIRSGASAKGTIIWSEHSFDVSNGSGNNAAYFDLTTGSTKVGIGTRTPSYKLHVMGQVAGSGAYVNSSDERYKRNIHKVPDALSKVMLLDGVYFDWRAEEYPKMNFLSKRDLGVIAQNVEKYFPEAVVEDKNGYKSVAYSKLVAPLIEAVKTQQKGIIELNKKFEDVKIENRALKQYLCLKDPIADFCN